MPPVAIGAVFVAMGASAATGAAVAAIATAAYIGAAVGAVVGAGMALATKGNILKGALMGAATGFVTGAFTAGLGGLAGGTGGGAGSAVGEAGLIGTEAAGSGASVAADATLTAGLEAPAAVVPATTAPAVVAPAAVAPAAVAPVKQVAGQGALAWMNANPTIVSGAAQALGGGAKAMLDSRTAEKKLEAEMERDRINRDALKITGIEDLQIRTVLPTISGFMDTPKWKFPEQGLIWGGMQNASKKTEA